MKVQGARISMKINLKNIKPFRLGINEDEEVDQMEPNQMFEKKAKPQKIFSRFQTDYRFKF